MITDDVATYGDEVSVPMVLPIGECNKATLIYVFITYLK